MSGAERASPPGQEGRESGKTKERAGAKQP